MLCFVTLRSYGQDDFKRNVYNRTSERIKRDFKFCGSEKKEDYRKCRLAQYELFCIGDYKEALAFSDSLQNPQFSFLDSMNYYLAAIKYRPIPAEDFIINQGRKNQIILLDENHHQPIHRVFAKRLLKDLYDIGYRYLAVEALINDSTINAERKLTRIQGLYLFEPQFSNFIKEAITIGYTLVSYEANAKELQNREYFQALHIKEKVFDKDRSAKLIVYCGFDHGCETRYGDSLDMMGAWLKRLTLIDPVTFDQVTMTEHSSQEYASTSFSFFREKQSAIFTENDSTYKPFDGSKGYDYYIYHPRTTYVNGRPDWILSNDVKEYYVDIPKIKLKFPLLISAYDDNEDPVSAMPVDVIELRSKQDRKPLLLKTAKYKLIVRDTEGNQQLLEVYSR
jgi:hypothetical protein